MGRRTVIHDVLTVTLDAQDRIGEFSIAIENDEIKEVSKTPISRSAADINIEGRHKVALPGFVNGHIHADVLLARGLGDGLTLHEQDQGSLIGRRRWFRHELTGEARKLGRMLQYVEALKGGTTFLCDFLFWLDPDDDPSGPFEATGMRGALAFDYRRDFLANEIREEWEIRAISESLKSHGIVPVLQGPSEEAFDQPDLVRLKSTADKFSLPIQFHLAETSLRRRIITERYGKTPVEFLNGIGFLDRRVMGSHGVQVDEADLDILCASGASIINSPTAEMKIADGVAPIAGMLAHGVTVGLGTDGALWNDSADMFREMKNLVLLQRVMYGASAMNTVQALRAATIGGATAFGIDHLYGSIETGKRASIVLINTLKPHLVPLHVGTQPNVVQNIVSCAVAGDVDTVIVDGEIVVLGGRLTRLDEDALVAQAQEMGSRIFSNITEAGPTCGTRNVRG